VQPACVQRVSSEEAARIPVRTTFAKLETGPGSSTSRP